MPHPRCFRKTTQGGGTVLIVVSNQINIGLRDGGGSHFTWSSSWPIAMLEQLKNQFGADGWVEDADGAPNA